MNSQKQAQSGLSGYLYCKIFPVSLYHTLRGIAVVTLSHCLAKLVDDCPDRPVALRPKLALDLLTGKTFFW